MKIKASMWCSTRVVSMHCVLTQKKRRKIKLPFSVMESNAFLNTRQITVLEVTSLCHYFKTLSYTLCLQILLLLAHLSMR